MKKKTTTKPATTRVGRTASKRAAASKAARTSTAKRTKKATPTRTAPAAAKRARKTATTTVRAHAAKPALVYAAPDHAFWLRDGQVLHTLLDLHDALATMSDELYRFHVTKEKNDFAAWVEHVLGDPACASALRTSRKPASARTVVARACKEYNV